MTLPEQSYSRPCPYCEGVGCEECDGTGQRVVTFIDFDGVTGRPDSEDVVQVLMTEDMARRFEERCLGASTRGLTSLSPPLLFNADDVPTYIIQVDE